MPDPNVAAQNFAKQESDDQFTTASVFDRIAPPVRTTVPGILLEPKFTTFALPDEAMTTIARPMNEETKATGDDLKFTQSVLTPDFTTKPMDLDFPEVDPTDFGRTEPDLTKLESITDLPGLDVTQTMQFSENFENGENEENEENVENGENDKIENRLDLNDIFGDLESTEIVRTEDISELPITEYPNIKEITEFPETEIPEYPDITESLLTEGLLTEALLTEALLTEALLTDIVAENVLKMGPP